MNPFDDPEKAKVNFRTEIVDYIRARCELAINPGPTPFETIYIECKKDGKPVCEGCAIAECTAYKKLLSATCRKCTVTECTAYTASARQTKTNAQLAAELGVSKRQVVKMRKRGEL